MKRQRIAAVVIASVAILANGAPAAQDRNALKSRIGISFAEFKGYERWQVIASSQSDDGDGCSTSQDPGCVRSILGNPVAVKMYASSVTDSGKPVPDGAAFARIEWEKARIAVPHGGTVPGKLAEISFMLKDSKRFPKTSGWGYATFRYNASSDTWTAISDFPDKCQACITVVRKRDLLYAGGLNATGFNSTANSRSTQ